MAFVPPAGVGAKRGLGAGAIILLIVGGFVLVMAICGGLGLAILLPALGKARQTARDTITMSQARRLNVSLAVYAMNNQDVMPSSTTWVTDLGFIYADEQLDSKRIDGPMPDYIYLPPAPRSGRTHGLQSDIANPSSYIILHEDTTRLPAQFTTVVVGMADGSVHMMGRDELAARLAKQAAERAKAAGAGPQ